MKVELVTITQGTGKHKGRTAEEMILFQARVSSSRDDNAKYNDPQLINWLLKQNPPHISPFQMADMGLHIECGLDVANQFKRHWSLAICEPLDLQELSMRYKESGDFDYLEFRNQGLINRQVGDGIHAKNGEYQGKAAAIFQQIEDFYDELVKDGVALECARRILPIASNTQFFVKGSVRSWISYISQRQHQHAQKEHRLLAIEILSIFQKNFPLTYKAVFLDKSNG